MMKRIAIIKAITAPVKRRTTALLMREEKILLIAQHKGLCALWVEFDTDDMPFPYGHSSSPTRYWIRKVKRLIIKGEEIHAATAIHFDDHERILTVLDGTGGRIAPTNSHDGYTLVFALAR